MTHSAGSEVSGQCLCGALRVTGRLDSPEVLACHCGQCRRQSGHYWASFHLEAPVIQGPVRWYRSSPKVQRGFCETCGSVMFWKVDGREAVSVSAGALDNPTGLELVRHIYVADKGDYYELADGLPQNPQ